MMFGFEGGVVIHSGVMSKCSGRISIQSDCLLLSYDVNNFGIFECFQIGFVLV